MLGFRDLYIWSENVTPIFIAITGSTFSVDVFADW